MSNPHLAELQAACVKKFDIVEAETRWTLAFASLLAQAPDRVRRLEFESQCKREQAARLEFLKCRRQLLSKLANLLRQGTDI